ncbi:MAG: hypothetical protein ACLQVL_03895 [Terriglobia bacterium]
MRNAALLVLLMLPLPVTAQKLEVQPSEIQEGKTATVTWDVGKAPAFLMGYGKVSGKGSAIVNPDSTTKFILIIKSGRTGGNYKYKTQQLFVTGGRGGDEFPPLSDFEAPITGRRTGVDYFSFQSDAWNMLQREGYKLRGEFAPARPYVTIYTNFILRPDLVSRNENVRARRLALAVEVYEPGKKGDPVSFGLRSRLEFQYTGGIDWHWDKESPLASTAAMKVMRLLQGTE